MTQPADPSSSAELHSIDQLQREHDARDRTTAAGIAGEARSWAAGPGSGYGPTYQPRAWVAPGEGHRRLSYESRTTGGDRIGVILTCEPIWDLARGEPVASYVRERRRRIPSLTAGAPEAAHEALVDHDHYESHPHGPPADAIRLEGLKFRRGLAMLEEQGPGYGVMTTPWTMLTTARGPFMALNTGVRGRIDPATRLIGEITDIPAGVDLATLSEVVAFLAARRRTVILRVPPDAEAVDAVARAGARGLSFSIVGPALERSGSAWNRMAALLHAARRIAPMVLIDHASPERSEELREAGATHAVFGPMRSRLI
jgi:hypothetical protein